MSEVTDLKITLEAARVNAGLTLDQASENLGTTKQTILSYEKGRTSPTIDMVLRMCELYGVSIDRLNFLFKCAN